MDANALARVCAETLWADDLAIRSLGIELISAELGNAVLEYNRTTGAFVGEFVAADSGGLSEPMFITFGPSRKE